MICDGAGAAALRVVAVDAAPVRPDPGLHPRDQPPLRRARRRMAARRRRHPQPRLLRRLARARCRLLRPDLPRRRARRLLGDDRPPPRPRRVDPRARCGIVDADDAYAEGLQFNAIKIEEEGRRNEWMWRMHPRQRPRRAARRRRHGGAGRRVPDRRRALRASCRALRHSRPSQAASEDLMDYSERLLRREIEKLPDGRYAAEGFIDGFPNDPNPANRDLRIKVDGHGRGLRHPRRPDRHLAADRPADQHAVRRNRRHRDLPDDPLDPARQRSPRQRSRRTPASSGRSRSRRPRAASPTRASRRRRSRASARATSSPTRSCARSRRSCRTASAPASATSRSSRTPGSAAAASTGSTWTSRRAATAGAPARTGSTPSTRSTRTPATTRSRTSSRTTRCA